MRSGLIKVAVLIFSFPIVLCAGDDSSSNQGNPVMLKVDSSKVLPIPYFSFETGPQCDSNGDLYFNTGHTAKSEVILKLTVRDGSATIFRPRDETAADTEFIAFHVTAESQVALLVSDKHEEPYVYLFNENDPSTASRIKLAVPEGVTSWGIQNFLVLPKGRIFLQGYYDNKAPERLKNKSFAAAFDASGSLLKISQEEVSADVLKSVAGRGAKTEAAQSKDGTTYLLYPDKIAVISPDGDVVRAVKLIPPAPGSVPDQLYMNRGRLVVGFNLADSSGKITTRYQLLNPYTGELIRLYQPEAELGSNLVCFSDDGLTFMRPEKGHAKLMNAPIR